MRITIVDPEKNTLLYQTYMKRDASYVSQTSSFQENLNEQTNALQSSSNANTDAAENTSSDTQKLRSSQERLLSIAKDMNNGKVPDSDPIQVPDDLLPIFKEASETYGVDEGLLIAIAKNESNFRTDATSSAGAMGIMQLMPQTAAGLGVTDGYDARQNIMGGAKLLSDKIKQYNGNVTLALAAYSAGSGSVSKYNGIPPYKETQNYIPRVLSNYARGYAAASENNSAVLPSADQVTDLIEQYAKVNGSGMTQDSSGMGNSEKTAILSMLYNGSARLIRSSVNA